MMKEKSRRFQPYPLQYPKDAVDSSTYLHNQTAAFNPRTTDKQGMQNEEARFDESSLVIVCCAYHLSASCCDCKVPKTDLMQQYDCDPVEPQLSNSSETTERESKGHQHIEGHAQRTIA